MLNQVQYRKDSIVINKDGNRWRRWWTLSCSRGFGKIRSGSMSEQTDAADWRCAEMMRDGDRAG